MNQLIDSWLTTINSIGGEFWHYAAGMFIQSGVLILSLLTIDFLLRKRVRATFRYWIWMLVFIKLILPPSLSLPTGVGYWFGYHLSADSVVLEVPSNTAPPKLVGAPVSEHRAMTAEIPQIQPPQSNPEPAAPATPAFSNFQALTWQAAVFILWLISAAVLSVLLIHRMLFVRKLIAQSEPSKNRYAEILDQCRQQLGIKRIIELRLSGKLQSPAVCGLFRPVILIPTGLLERLSPDKLRAVLIHELAHIKRGDLWINCMQTILQIIYFYNPFVWLANVVVRRIREQAVDEMVLVALGAEAKSYSNILIDIAEMSFFKTSLSLRLIGVVESKKAIRRRIRHMLNRPIPKSAKLGILGLLVVTITGTILLPMAKAGKSKEIAVEDNVSNESQFIAILPNGVTVELLGICEHPSEGKQWWRPDGSKLSQRPFEKLHQRSYEKLEFYELALKIGNPENRKLSIIGKGGNVFNLYSDNIWGGFVLSEGKKMLNQSIGIAQGPWKTIMEANPMHTQSFGDIAFGKAFESDVEGIGVAVGVTVTHTVDKEKADYRVIAVDQKSNIHTSSGHSGIGNSLWMQTIVHFKDLQIDKIKEFQFQTRPYQWVEFKNVSLKPNFKTDVQVEVVGERATRLTMQGGEISVLKGESGPDVVVRRKLPPEGTAYYKKFDEEYLLEIVSKSYGQNIKETVGRKTSGETSGPKFVQKRIGFEIPFAYKGVDRSRKKVEFKKQLYENIKQDIKDILRVTAGGGGVTDLQHLEYSTDKVVGSISIYFSQTDEDILQLKFTIHEVVTAENKTDMLRVPSDRYPTIQSAVDAAKEGDKIILDPSVTKDDIPEQNKQHVNTIKSNQYATTLPNGVTVELVGLFTGQSKEYLTWWRPDGTLMSQQEYALYEGKIRSQNIRHHETWEFEYGYVLRFSPSDVSVMVDVTVGMRGACEPPGNDGFSINYVESDKNQREKGLPRIGAINIAAAYGPFTAKGWNRGSMGGSNRVGFEPQSFSLDDGSTIMLTPVRPDRYEPESGLMVDAIVNANDVDINVLYESKDGKKQKVEMDGFGGSSLVSPFQKLKPMMQYTFRLRSIKQEDLKRIAVEYRRFKGISFKDVALKPNVKTDVKIEAIGAFTANRLLTDNLEENPKVQDGKLLLLENERDLLGDKIKNYNQTIRQLGQEYGTIDLEGRQEMMLQRVSNLLNTLTTVEAEKIALEVQIQLLERTREQAIAPEKLLEMRQNYINQDPALVAYINDITELEQENIVAKQTLTPTHPEIQSKTTLLETLKNRLTELKLQASKNFDEMAAKETAAAGDRQLTAKRNELEQKKAYEKRLRELLSHEDSKAIELGRKQMVIEELKERLKSDKDMYNALMRRIKDLEMQQDRSANYGQ